MLPTWVVTFPAAGYDFITRTRRQVGSVEARHIERRMHEVEVGCRGLVCLVCPLRRTHHFSHVQVVGIEVFPKLLQALKS